LQTIARWLQESTDLELRIYAEQLASEWQNRELSLDDLAEVALGRGEDFPLP